MSIHGRVARPFDAVPPTQERSASHPEQTCDSPEPGQEEKPCAPKYAPFDSSLMRTLVLVSLDGRHSEGENTV